MLHDSPLAPHQAKGTPTWLAPERFSDPAAVSYASDVFSLAIVIWQLYAYERNPYPECQESADAIRAFVVGTEEVPGRRPALSADVFSVSLMEKLCGMWHANPESRADIDKISKF